MFKNLLRLTLVKMPSYRVPIEDEVFRSMKVDNFSKTPYSDATQVCDIITIVIISYIHQDYVSMISYDTVSMNSTNFFSFLITTGFIIIRTQI